MSVLPPPDQKAAYVEQMFSRIAAGYDRMNGALTLGMDRGWRDLTASSLQLPPNGFALDVGTGTGDFLPVLAAAMPRGFVVGVDFALPMMQAGLPKTQSARSCFAAADALVLPFADNTFDAITTGFVMRNVVDIPRAFAEMCRVARPGALIGCLEVARPEQPLLRIGHQLYFQRLVPLLARALGGDATAYTYLPQSARAFPPPPALAQIMRDAGWADVSYRLLGFGAAALHIGTKP